ncbi:DoxX family protein [Aridibaculum aurantiacum]|uniref:DoxX family protein n=1 Tax=Aridibaculum aurantiacum TaxID=2810307 RepID=UPI001A960C0F|nr:DoxX family protein [Aridibaculum aurantiacum]
MTTKTANITYWVTTIIFAGLMIFSSVGGLQPSQQAIDLMHHYLGYPIYFIQFISVAKLLGAVVILVPTRSFIKSWAYAGLFFDLSGAIYSTVATAGKIDPMMLTLLLWIVPGVVSFYLWNRQQILVDNKQTGG